MSRIVYIIAAVAVIGAVVIVMQFNKTTPGSPPEAGETNAPNYDTIGGQQMQPRWNR